MIDLFANVINQDAIDNLTEDEADEVLAVLTAAEERIS
jgi:hypothetical protein